MRGDSLASQLVHGGSWSESKSPAVRGGAFSLLHTGPYNKIQYSQEEINLDPS